MKLKDVIEKSAKKSLDTFLNETVTFKETSEGGKIYTFQGGEVWVSITGCGTMFRNDESEDFSHCN